MESERSCYQHEHACRGQGDDEKATLTKAMELLTSPH